MRIDNPSVVTIIEHIHRDLADNNYENLVKEGYLTEEGVIGIKSLINSQKNSITVPPLQKLSIAKDIWFTKPRSTNEARYYLIEQYLWLNNEESDFIIQFLCSETIDNKITVQIGGLVT
ncbi:MAG: hypothetical protein RLP44_01825 [Aggregatilineales bacterium]